MGELDFTEDLIKNWSAQAAGISQDETAPNQALLNRCNARAVQCLGGTLEKRYYTVALACHAALYPLICG